ncbi:MAG: YHS domain-containing protein [Bacteroidetes bacterium]|nr:YHS domain-containing protein [Bacteroidota bacterium]
MANIILRKNYVCSLPEKNWILASEAADKTEYNGKTYYFCCPNCKAQFEKEPAKYLED